MRCLRNQICLIVRFMYSLSNKKCNPRATEILQLQTLSPHVVIPRRVCALIDVTAANISLEVLSTIRFRSRDLYWPIRCQYSGHRICIDQSGVSIYLEVLVASVAGAGEWPNVVCASRVSAAEGQGVQGESKSGINIHCQPQVWLSTSLKFGLKYKVQRYESKL